MIQYDFNSDLSVVAGYNSVQTKTHTYMYYMLWVNNDPNGILSYLTRTLT